MDISQENSFKKGDFVFAKIRGYRAWPARILQPIGRTFNVFFYGTCNTAIVGVKNLFPYEKFKHTLGILKEKGRLDFKRAMKHADLMIANPSGDEAFKYMLASLDNYSTLSDGAKSDLGEESDVDVEGDDLILSDN